LRQNLQTLGQLESRDMLGDQQPAQPRKCEGLAWLQHNEGTCSFAENRIRHCDQRDRVHRRVLQDQVLNLVDADFLTPTIAEVASASFGVDIASLLCYEWRPALGGGPPCGAM